MPIQQYTPIQIAERTVSVQYGDTVSVFDKGKQLNKFGSNSAIANTFETVAQFQGATANETFVTTNIVDSVVSSSTSDTSQTITVEGHTVDGSGNLTFVSQDAILNGQNEVTLSTPLARCNRAFVKPTGTALTFPTALVGTVYVYDNTGGISAGVPVTAAATKCLILAGETQSKKCATAISSTDYWFLTEFFAGLISSSASVNRVTFKVEMRNVASGGAWRPIGTEIVLNDSQNPQLVTFDPFLIIPKNNDVRVQAKLNSGTGAVFAELNGYLAGVQ